MLVKCSIDNIKIGDKIILRDLVYGALRRGDVCTVTAIDAYNPRGPLLTVLGPGAVKHVAFLRRFDIEIDPNAPPPVREGLVDMEG